LKQSFSTKHLSQSHMAYFLLMFVLIFVPFLFLLIGYHSNWMKSENENRKLGYKRIIK